MNKPFDDGGMPAAGEESTPRVGEGRDDGLLDEQVDSVKKRAGTTKAEFVEIEVDEGLARQRLDRAISRHLTDLSRNQVKHAILNEGVEIDGRTVTRPSQKLGLGQRVRLRLPDNEELELRPDADIALDILFADEHLIVVDKPAGLVVHPALGHPRGTLVNRLLVDFPELATRFDDMRPGIVHRLDRDTSGVMIIARTKDAAENLKAQFKARLVEKTYLSLVRGIPNPPEGIIEAPIGRDARDRKRMTTRPDGKPAETVYRILAESLEYAWVAVFPRSGRTHQIRVHFKAIGHPVVADPVYGRSDPRIPRLALHASSIAFAHPHSGERVSFTAPLSKDIGEALESIGLDPMDSEDH